MAASHRSASDQTDPGVPVQGRLRVHPRGFGFLELPPGDDRTHGVGAFVPPGEVEGLLQSDLVRARLITEADGRFLARDLELVRRERTDIFGTIDRRGKRVIVRPDPQLGSSPWPVTGDTSGLRRGTPVVATIDGEAVTVRRTVSRREAAAESLLVRWDVPTDYPDEVEQRARRAKGLRIPRRDLRQIPTVTIDAASTRDIDDAVSALPAQADGAVRVMVSIADVSAYVHPGDALDREARRRGTSVYLPDRVVPMFPPALSEDRVSLLEGKERSALTAELRIDPEGTVTAVDIYPSRIRSHARLTYVAVAAYLDDGDASAVPSEVQETLRWLRTAAARLSTARAARGGVRFFPNEAKIELDARGEPTDISLHDDSSAHQLIERLMVAANEAVAQWLADRGLPALYRVHPEPDPAAVARLAEFAHGFDLAPGFGPVLTPLALAAFQQQYETSGAAPAVRSVLRRTLGPARYTPEPGPHFGLGSALYLHFTSPIRRYADLVVHRVVKDYLAGDRSADPDDPTLLELAEHLNQRAYQARRAETERLRSLAARLFAGRIGEELGGRIIEAKPFGLVVQLRGLGITGGINAESLPGKFRLDPRQQAWVAQRGNKRFAVGQSVRVTVVKTDEALGRIEVELV